MRMAIPILAAAALLAGCGGRPEPRAVPSVTGERLDVAEALLDSAGLSYEVAGGGTFGVIARRRWQVCRQEPLPGRKAAEVTLVIARSCNAVPPGRGGVVPDVEYQALDEAQDELLRAGLGWEIEAEGRIVVRSRWEVCDQEPAPGEWATTVELYVEREC